MLNREKNIFVVYNVMLYNLGRKERSLDVWFQKIFDKNLRPLPHWTVRNRHKLGAFF